MLLNALAETKSLLNISEFFLNFRVLVHQF